MKNYYKKTTASEIVIAAALQRFMPEAEQIVEAEVCPKCRSMCQALGIPPHCERPETDCKAYRNLVKGKAWGLIEAANKGEN
jgi:hypothetical protein